MIPSLWLKLVLPLALLSALFLLVHSQWQADGLFINLATEVLGIVVTVAYVDWILRRHEARRWIGAETRISASIRILINKLILGFRDVLGFGFDVMNEAEVLSGDFERGNREMLRVAEHVLTPGTRSRLEVLDKDGWKRLDSHLQDMWLEAERILDRFSHRLKPRQMKLLLDIQTSLQGARIFWLTFPNLAGTRGEPLPETRTPPELLQEQGYDSTAREIRKLMSLADELTSA